TAVALVHPGSTVALGGGLTARLRRLFPDVTLEEVTAATGFEFAVAPDLAPVQTPSRDQIDLVRAIDPLGVRRREFRPVELERSFSL
ncbi:MAG: hypothetical protein OXH89_03320, partial [bacterium]|nr:hypothetical protein [bacterium]